MKYSLSKGLVLLLAVVLCALSLASCGQDGAPDWEGSFYKKGGEGRELIFSFYTYGEQDQLRVSRTVSDINGRASVGETAWLDEKKPSVAEDDYFTYTLKGDALTVKSIDKEDFTLEFEGSYTRGERLEAIEYFGTDDDPAQLQLGAFYSLDGDLEQLTMLFFDDDTVIFSEQDWQSDYFDFEYDMDNAVVTIYSDDGSIALYLLDDGTLISEDGEVFIAI